MASSNNTSSSSSTGLKPRLPSTWRSPSTPTSSGIPALKTLRSLLPFGSSSSDTSTPSKAANSSGYDSPSSSRVSFSSFGYSRKSSVSRRTRNASMTAVADSPVISIQRPSADVSRNQSSHRRSVSLTTLDKQQEKENLREEKPLPSKPSSEDLLGVPDAESSLLSEEFILPPSPDSNPAAELSTIIEADSSGISKHLPAASRSPSHSPDIGQLLQLQPSSFASSAHPHRSDSGHAASTLDLSTTRLTEEVLNAFDSGSTGWRTDPTIIDVDEDESSKETNNNGRTRHYTGNVSLDMDDLDPDLAALLSPNKLTSNNTTPSPFAGNSTVVPSKLDASPLPKESRRSASVTLAHSSLTSSMTTRQPQQQQPRRPMIGRTASTPPLLLRSRGSREGSQESLNSAFRLDGKNNNSNSVGPRPPTSPLGSSTGSGSIPSSMRRGSASHASIGNNSSSRLYTPTPLPLKALSSSPTDVLLSRDRERERSRSSLDLFPRRASLDRGPQSTYYSSSTLPPRSASTVPPRSPSVLTTFSNPNSNTLSHGTRSRKRSMSVDEQPSPKAIHLPGAGGGRYGSIGRRDSTPSNGWLGPRTVKAFRAAGLLSRGREREREEESNETLQHYPHPQRHSGRPRNLSISEFGVRHGGASSLGRSSPTTTNGWSPTTYSSRGDRDNFVTPNTTPARSVSTVPSSSASASASDEVITELKERHQVETAALLSALSDSQRQTRVLREENEELRAEVEKALDELSKVSREKDRLERAVVEMQREREREREVEYQRREREREYERMEREAMNGRGERDDDILDWQQTRDELIAEQRHHELPRAAAPRGRMYISPVPSINLLRAWDKEDHQLSIPRRSSPLRQTFDDYSPSRGGTEDDLESERYYSAVGSRRSSPLKEADHYVFERDDVMALDNARLNVFRVQDADDSAEDGEPLDEDDTAKYYPATSTWGRKHHMQNKKRLSPQPPHQQPPPALSQSQREMMDRNFNTLNFSNPYATPDHTQTFTPSSSYNNNSGSSRYPNTPLSSRAGGSSSSLQVPTTTAATSSNSVSRKNSANSVSMAPPASMHMLMHDDDWDLPPTSRSSATSGSMRFSQSQRSQHQHVRSLSKQLRQQSAQPPSPTTTTADLSIRTGSPSSLFLKPEHELHLGDMESLDLSMPLVEDDADDDADFGLNGEEHAVETIKRR